MTKFGIIGTGSWATALAKMLNENNHPIQWWSRNADTANYINNHHHNPGHLTSVVLKKELVSASTNLKEVIRQSDILVIAVPSAYIAETLSQLEPGELNNKKIVSAIKGIVPAENLLLNDYLQKKFAFPLSQYFAVLGPCHAEEVASERLSYLTFSGQDITVTKSIATHFASHFIRTIINPDIFGVQYAAVLKNIYALGAGIAHGLGYGDNFQSVLIANSADEMAGFLRKFGAQHIVVGEHTDQSNAHFSNYAASVYLGDLLVTCYSLYSRNRTFGNMIGKGYSVKAAQLELNMVAEGFYASKCIYDINRQLKAETPIAETVYQILWENISPENGFKKIEKILQ